MASGPFKLAGYDMRGTPGPPHSWEVKVPGWSGTSCSQEVAGEVKEKLPVLAVAEWRIKAAFKLLPKFSAVFSVVISLEVWNDQPFL